MCDGRVYPVHKMVLASSSPFFDQILKESPLENPSIILNDAKAGHVEALLQYMYCGQVSGSGKSRITRRISVICCTALYNVILLVVH